MTNADKKNGTAGKKPAGRAKGTGSLEKHGKTWRAVWKVDGKVFRRSTGTSIRKAAELKLEEFIAPYRLKYEAAKDASASRNAGGAGLTATASALADAAQLKRAAAGRLFVSLDKAWETFDTSLMRNPVSAAANRRYAARWTVLLDWLKVNRPGFACVADVDEEAAAAFMQTLRGVRSPKTFNDYRFQFAQMWRVLDKPAGLSGFNPWQEIKTLAKAAHRRRELTAEELARVVAPLEGEMRILFAIGIYTGLRLGDAVNLSWGAVDLVRGFIQWTPHKTAKHGTVVRIPLFPALALILAETPPKMRIGFVLPQLAADYNAHGQRISDKVRRIFEAAGIQTQVDSGRVNLVSGTPRKAIDVGFHSLRHTFVSLCANAGVPLHLVQAIVGHSNVAMTEHYFHVSDDALRGVVAGLPDVFRPPASLPSRVEEPLEAVPASVARVARMLVGCSQDELAQAERLLSDFLASRGGFPRSGESSG